MILDIKHTDSEVFREMFLFFPLFLPIDSLLTLSERCCPNIHTTSSYSCFVHKAVHLQSPFI